MSDFGLPEGVKQRTGTLVHRDSQVATTGNTTTNAFASDPGPGYVIGILGATFSYDATGTDGTNVSQGWSVDPDRTAWSDSAPDIVISRDDSLEVTTSGMDIRWTIGIMLPAPILTTRNMTYIVRSASGAIDGKTTLYYAIFEVSDSAFLRIAGISLSRS